MSPTESAKPDVLTVLTYYPSKLTTLPFIWEFKNLMYQAKFTSYPWTYQANFTALLIPVFRPQKQLDLILFSVITRSLNKVCSCCFVEYFTLGREERVITGAFQSRRKKKEGERQCRIQIGHFFWKKGGKNLCFYCCLSTGFSCLDFFFFQDKLFVWRQNIFGTVWIITRCFWGIH